MLFITEERPVADVTEAFPASFLNFRHGVFLLHVEGNVRKDWDLFIAVEAGVWDIVNLVLELRQNPQSNIYTQSDLKQVPLFLQIIEEN